MTTQIQTIIENAEVFRQDPPRPLRREASPATAYPLAALGPILGQAAQAIHEKIQAPQAIGAQSVIAAATLAVQGHANIELPIGQCRPLSAFFMTIATTGERKSSCDAEALKPLNLKEEALRAQYTVDLSRWRNEKEAWDLARSHLLKKGKQKSPQEIAASLSALGDCPDSPLLPLLTCPEPTFEGICKHLVTGQPSLGIFSDEGGQFIGGYGMNEDNRLKTAGAFCSLWDGNAYRVFKRKKTAQPIGDRHS